MCGIAAFFSSDKRISAQRLKHATNCLRHRGPDSQGAWLSPNQRVGLGHARLSIIDLTTGDQPIANEDERVHIVVNGEFYDFERQRRELERRGHLFRTRSDSEIALHLYEEFGAHCVQQLRGEFAFVLWDEANQTLLAARDRFGIKPLYYAVHDDTLYLASEIKALFAGGVPKRWDQESFYQAATGPGMCDRTLFDGVHQVPPGHYLTTTTNGMRILRYWEFYYPPADELRADTRGESALVEEFAAVFEEAVRLRLRADVPVGCYLSGGLDSCSVLGFAARLSSWGLAGAIGAVAGMMAAPIVYLDPNMMSGILLYGFAGALLGGIDNPWGAALGGFIVGILENIAGAYVIGTELKLTVALVIIVGALVFKPAGLFGRTLVTRV